MGRIIHGDVAEATDVMVPKEAEAEEVSSEAEAESETEEKEEDAKDS